MFLINATNNIQGESFDTYLTSLCSLVKTCNFGGLKNSLLRDRIVLGLSDNSTRKKLLAEPKLTLEKCINICRANESTTNRSRDITSDEINVKQTTRRPLRTTGNPQRTAGHPQWTTGNPRGNTPVPRNKGFGQGHKTLNPPLIKCKFCIKPHARKKGLWVAWNKTSSGSSVCPGKQTKHAVHAFDELSVDSVDDYFLYIESVDAISADYCPRKIFASMRLI